MCEVKKTQEQTNIRFEQFKIELEKIDEGRSFNRDLIQRKESKGLPITF